MDYEQLEKELIKINYLPVYKEIEKIEDEFTYRDTYIPANSYYAEHADMKGLAAQLVHYFTVVYKNFEFNGFYDKMFVDAVKALVKDPEEFTLFLKMIDTDIETFIKIMVHLSPQVFTSNLVKFIQKNYLNIEPVGKKIQKRKK